MSELLIEQIPALSDNYVYLLHEPNTGATAVVDPAAAEPVQAALAARGWRLSHILNTHHHQDHTGANLALKKAWDCSVVGARRDAARIPGIDVEVGNRDTIMLGDAAAMIFEVPGHTSGHIAYWFPDSRALFCGDTLFSLGCGRLFEGTAEEMWRSLLTLRDLPAETRVYCGHEYTQANARFARTVERDNDALKERVGEVERLRAADKPTVPTTIAAERAANPFLRADEAAVQQAVGLPGGDPVAVFAELRRRKDAF